MLESRLAMSIPRPEYPRPQYVRETWLNLNGCWEFALDPGCSGRARGLAAAEKLEQKIIVPFCPESSLSGVGIIDFMPAVWYRREVEIPAEWAGQRILLHFGAVDYASEMWVNGVSAGTHRGGYSSFTFEITSLLQAGINVITVCAEDDTRSQLQPSGKQSELYASAGCHYTRTTGIWQTVWLEAVPATYLDRPFISANLENGAFELAIPLIGEQRDLSLQIQASFAGLQVGTVTVFPCGQQFYAHLPLFSIHPWSPQQPSLYDLILTLRDAAGNIIDRITSYAGLRSITLAPPKVLINNRAIFQRLVLDQGYYPDGIYTAPSDDALRGDIEIAQAMGFNGARLHQKVFEERFLYWADKLGYLVWGEMANWGLDLAHPLAQERFQSEWCEVLARDFNHPCIIGWCPFNETQSNQNPEVLRQIYRLTKQLDPTRPVIDTSGWVHVESDIYDVHDYQQDPTLFAQSYTRRIADDFGAKQRSAYLRSATARRSTLLHQRIRRYLVEYRASCGEQLGVW